MHIRRISMDKDVVDRVPPSLEMCCQTILIASSKVEFEKTRGAYTQAQYQQKVQQETGSKEEKKENPKSMDKE